MIFAFSQRSTLAKFQPGNGNLSLSRRIDINAMPEILDQPPATEQQPTALFRKRKANTNIRKRPATPPPAPDDSSEYSSEDEGSVKVRRRKKEGVAVKTSGPPQGAAESLGASKYEADQSNTITQTNDATKQSNWYDENADGAMSEQQLLGKSSHGSKKDEAPDDGTYKGSANYQSYIQKNPNAPQKQVGPQKAPSNIRTVTTMDFKPDICKDYAKTGYCGFGDTCIFLHDRADWKQGWQIDREWEIETKGKKPQGKTVASASRTANKDDDITEEEAKMLEDIPFACKICEQPYKKPTVQTKCGHYFCEKCALERYKKNPSCAICGSGTNGVFNNAKNLNKLLDKKKERERRKKEQEEKETEGDGGRWEPWSIHFQDN